MACILPTETTKKLAQAVGLDESVALLKIQGWMTENGTLEYPSVEELKNYIKEHPVKVSLDVLPGTDVSNVTIVTSLDKVASTNVRQRSIKLSKPSFTPEEVIDHLFGKGNKKFSDQKKKVMSYLAKTYGITEDYMREILRDNTIATSFVLTHEQSHIAHSDSYDISNYMSDDAIQIEARATLDAIRTIFPYVQNYFRNYSKAVQLFESEFAKYFDFGNSLPIQLSEELNKSINNFVNGIAPLTPSTAIKFLEEIKKQNLRLYNEAKNKFYNLETLEKNTQTTQEKTNTANKEQNSITQTQNTVGINYKSNEDIIRLINSFTPRMRFDRASYIADLFLETAKGILQDTIESLESQIAKEEAKEVTAEREDFIQELRNRIQAYQDKNGLVTFLSDIGSNLIFDAVKQTIEESVNNENLSEYERVQFKKMADNFKLLSQEACAIIEDIEGIRVSADSSSLSDIKTLQEQEEEDRDFEDDEMQNRVTGNDGWSFKIRYIDPYSTVSKEVKHLLGHLYMTDSEGIPLTDDMGRMRKLNSHHAHLTLLSLMSQVKDINEFYYEDNDGNPHFPILEKNVYKYPWLQQVINTLSDSDNEYLVSKFYKDLRQDFILYYQQIFSRKDGIMKDSACSAPSELDSALSNLLANYTQGILLDKSSLYTKSGKVNKDSADTGLKMIAKLNSLLSDFDDLEEIAALLTNGLRMLGFNINQDAVTKLLESENAIKDIRTLVTNMQNIFDGSKNMKEDSHLIDYFKNYYTAIAKIIGTVSETNLVASFRLGSKSLYSYSAPNWINTLVKNLKDHDNIQQFVEAEFGYDIWFKKDGKWRSGWIQELLTDEELRDNLQLSHLVIINEGANTKFQDKEYDEWTPQQIRKSFLIKYFSGGKKYGIFNLPILSDAPVAMFIKFKKYTDNEFQTFEEQIIPKLRDVVLQEMGRIEKVKKRIENGVQCIQNYDTGKKNGLKFNFFPELNADKEFLKTCQVYIDNNNTDGLNAYIDKKISTIVESLFKSYLKNSEEVKTELKDQLKKDKIINSDSDEDFNRALKEYFYNQIYATTQIIELTTTDLAFYKNGVDFQKRYKEIYAAGYKLNTNAKFNGERVGKDFRRTVYLKDHIITSKSFNNLRENLDKAVAANHIQSFDRDNILNKFEDINVADAQSYINPEALRSVLVMMGEWTDDLEKSFQNIKNGNWDMSDFNAVYQTIKPFLYTQIATPDGIGSKMRVPHQNKNSEFMLTALYSLVANSYSSSPELRAIQRFMRDNDIDTIQFESAVKVGGQGTIDLSYSSVRLQNWVNSSNNEKAVQELLETEKAENKKDLYNPKVFKEANDELLTAKKITQEEYNKRMEAIRASEKRIYDILTEETKIQPKEAKRAATGEFGFKEDGSPRGVGDFKETVVHSLPYKDYCIQQPTKEHLFDAEVIFGSQFRNLIAADLPEDFKVKVNGIEYNKQGIVRLYQSLIVENLLDAYTTLKGKLATIEDLQRELLDSVRANDKFNRDIVDALQLITVKDENGRDVKVFNIPLNNMATTIKLQQVVTSFFKNRITKQYINGGACFLVSDYGLTDELITEYNEDGSLKGVQCYLPANSRKFYEPFLTKNANGRDILDINSMPDDMKKMVGYRIPTEDKYSMVPLIVKGFLPQQNGSSIMLPADITQHAGSDFDIDKLFIMMPQFDVEYYDLKKTKNFYDKHIADTSKIATKTINVLFEEDLPDEFKDFKSWWDKNKQNYPEFRLEKPRIRKIKYNQEAEVDQQTGDRKRQKAKRDNMIIDIAHAILCHPDTLEKFNNPGNFDGIKVQGAIDDIINDENALNYFMEKYNIKTLDGAVKKILFLSRNGKLKELQNFIEDYNDKFKSADNFLTPDTFIYNHTQNTTGGKLIGMYANNTTMQAKYQYSSLQLKDGAEFKINGRTIKSLHDIFSGLGERISKNCAQFSAASVDNVKDPELAKLLQNTKTANITAFMLRAGLSIEEINLLFQQPDIRHLIQATRELTQESIATVINGYINEYGEEVFTEASSNLVTSESLLQNILCVNKPEFQNHLSETDKRAQIAKTIAALHLMYNIVELSDQLAQLTQISRADSPNGAVSNSIAGYKVQMEKVNFIMNIGTYKDFKIEGISDGLYNGYITDGMSKDALRRELMKRPMPILQAFHSLGIEFASNILRYFPQYNQYTDKLLRRVINNAPSTFLKYKKSAEKLINKFYREICEFALTKTALFGDDGNATFIEKRDYYLKKFPNKLRERLQNDPELREMGLFKKLLVDNVITLPKSGRTDRKSNEFLMRDLEMLLFNPKYTELAKDLFMYSFYQEGLWFGPNSINGLFSSTFLSAFPEYIDTLRFMDKKMKDGSFYDKFLDQFYANNYRTTVPNYKNASINDGQVTLALKDVWKRKDGRGSVYDYIRVGNRLFKRDLLVPIETLNETECVTYYEVPAFSGDSIGATLYNANMNVSELKQYDISDESEEPYIPKIPDEAYAADIGRILSKTPVTQQEVMPELKDATVSADDMDLDFGAIADELEQFANDNIPNAETIASIQHDLDILQNSKKENLTDLPKDENSNLLKKKPCKP